MSIELLPLVNLALENVKKDPRVQLEILYYPEETYLEADMVLDPDGPNPMVMRSAMTLFNGIQNSAIVAWVTTTVLTANEVVGQLDPTPEVTH